MAEKDEEFINAAIGGDCSDLVLRLDAAFQGVGSLERAIEWIRENMAPMDVFERFQLDEWAKMNGYTPPQPDAP